MNKDDLEQLVDQMGMPGVLSWLEQIAFEKAYHLESNWQDGNTAKDWTKAARAIGTAEIKVSKLLA